MNFLRSEWIKLATTRTTWVMIGIGLLGEALFAGLFTGLTSIENLSGSENFDELATGIGLILTLILVLGVLMITTEFRHGTTGSTFLVSPKRYPVMVAKFFTALLFGAFVGLVFVAINAALVLPILDGRGVALPDSGHIVSLYAGGVAALALLCAFGYGIGAIVRNQVGAIIAAIAIFFIVSSLPELISGNWADYFPAQALGSLQGNPNDEGLTQIVGGLVLAGWAVAASAIGTLIVIKRDLQE